MLFFLFALIILTDNYNGGGAFALRKDVGKLPSSAVLMFCRRPSCGLSAVLLSGNGFACAVAPSAFAVFSLLLKRGRVLPVCTSGKRDIALGKVTKGVRIGKGKRGTRLTGRVRCLDALRGGGTTIVATISSLVGAGPDSCDGVCLVSGCCMRSSLPSCGRVSRLVGKLDNVVGSAPCVVRLRGGLDRGGRLARRHCISGVSYASGGKGAIG